MRTVTLRFAGGAGLTIEVPESESEDTTMIEVCDLGGAALAGIEFTAHTGSTSMTIGHWPDGEEWVDVADIALPERQ